MYFFSTEGTPEHTCSFGLRGLLCFKSRPLHQKIGLEWGMLSTHTFSLGRTLANVSPGGSWSVLSVDGMCSLTLISTMLPEGGQQDLRRVRVTHVSNIFLHHSSV